MKTKVLDNIFLQKELFYMYNTIISTPNWCVAGSSSDHKGFHDAPVLRVKLAENCDPINYPLFLWGKTVVFRIAKLLKEKNIGIPLSIERMWFNITYNGKKTQHWLHKDDNSNSAKSILLFMTPIWQPDWRGSFYVDGEEFKFKPGSAVIFDSNEYHQGEAPESENYNWQRLTCNILIK